MDPSTPPNPQAVQDYLELVLACGALPEVEHTRIFMEICG